MLTMKATNWRSVESIEIMQVTSGVAVVFTGTLTSLEFPILYSVVRTKEFSCLAIFARYFVEFHF